ncbi:outer membrane protein assembly factor BamE [Gallibacterium trehalosifermentans]|uniref:Outer membrane protein assembly factor BamE n=1 Tax=Gallibacterium trehalosifermentans TaxID=516935 RepID=A0ABV6H0M5_9PAST
MKLKVVLLSSLFALGLAACSSPVEKLVYRIDVPQGNYLDDAVVEKLQKGMTQEQVQYLLGTPLVVDPFNPSNWVYVQRIQKGHQKPLEKKLVVHFNQKRVVESFDFSPELRQVDVKEVEKPELVEEVKAAENPGSAESESKSWWQFWK